MRLGLGHPLQLGFFERPVFDVELLSVADGRVGRDRFGSTHDVDGVDVELASNTGRLLVGTVAEHADAGNENDKRVGSTDRGGVIARVLVVVRGVILAVLLVQLFQTLDALLDRGVGRQVEQQWLDFGAQEVVRAARAEGCELGGVGRGEVVEYLVGVSEVTDHGAVMAGDATDRCG